MLVTIRRKVYVYLLDNRILHSCGISQDHKFCVEKVKFKTRNISHFTCVYSSSNARNG